MVTVAVAGGSGSIGSAVVAAIAATKKHTVFVLSRKETGKFAEAEGVSVLVVDYESTDATADILSTNNVDTIISCLNLNSEEGNAAQVNLIVAAEKSSTVRRFAPSEYGIDYLKAPPQFPAAEFKVSAVERLRKSRLAYTRFLTGAFMDYFGPQGAPTTLQMIYLVVDHANKKAVIPGDGNTPVVLTHSTDVGRFVAASLDLAEWDDASVIVGDRLTLNELTKHAEDKFEVVYQSVERLQAGEQIDELPGNKAAYNFMPKEAVDTIRKGAGLGMAQGLVDLALDDKSLNRRFPEITPLNIREFFSKYRK
ncbi:hypothetical protein PLICBS_008027 [Purpureocillium lilacinum]|uniref:uncharacterized protein n=1 Tax=Purpureocillium lilacinum TaxID=33203 RepID=UPI00207E3B32|nr:hypothetical protein PLICBS_008027 [Purpureocillium lilacinum]